MESSDSMSSSSNKSHNSKCSNGSSNSEHKLEIKDLHKQGGFNLSMRNANLKDGIAFVTKFTHVFSKIQTIDFGDNKLQAD